MKKQIALFALVTAALLAMPAVNFAQDAAKPATGDQTTPVPKKNGLPFKGKIASLDATAGTLTVGSLTITVTSTTKITKDGKPATLADFAVGDQVAGAYKKDGEKLNATMLHNAAAKKKKAE